MELDHEILRLEMGLEFCIEIPAEEWSQLVTVNDVLQFLERQEGGSPDWLPLLTSSTVPGQALFLWLRRNFPATALPLRRRIRPSDRLDDLFPRERRINRWLLWQQRSQLAFPELSPLPTDRWKNAVPALGGLAMLIGCGLTFLATPSSLGDWDIPAYLLLAAAGIVVVLCPPVRNQFQFPARLQTVRDLVVTLLPQLRKSDGNWGSPFDREVAFARLQALLARLWDVAPSEIPIDSRLVATSNYSQTQP